MSVYDERAMRTQALALAFVLCACSKEMTPSDEGFADAFVAADASPNADAGVHADAAPGEDALPAEDAAPADASAADAEPVPSTCAPLPAATGATMQIGPNRADDLPAIVAGAAEGTTILLEDGMYRSAQSGESARRIQFTTPNVTLRSLSNDPNTVIIDGEYLTNEILTIHASNVTIAHLTVMHAVDHPVHITPPGNGGNITGAVLYGLRIIDGGEQFVKINSNGAGAYADQGRVECSSFLMSDGGREHVERNPGGCYTGGIDGHGALGWAVRHNYFEDIYCAGEGLAEHAVHFWTGSRDTLVENNVIIGCARGVGFGLGESGDMRAYPDIGPEAGYLGHIDGIIRNNVIFADHPYFDTGIELQQAKGVKVYHNTVVSTDAATGFFSSIDYRFANTDADIRNNLVRRITARDNAMGRVESNLENTPDSYFVDVPMHDFHLSASADNAIDVGVVLPEAGLDLDGEPHTAGAAPDLGADESR